VAAEVLFNHFDFDRVQIIHVVNVKTARTEHQSPVSSLVLQIIRLVTVHLSCQIPGDGQTAKQAVGGVIVAFLQGGDVDRVLAVGDQVRLLVHQFEAEGDALAGGDE